MKKLSLGSWLLLLVLCHSTMALAKQNVLNIYTWGNFLPISVLNQFTKETGIKVNVTEYDNNETMFTKIRRVQHATYDIVTPSSYYVERMTRQGLLHRLDKRQLPNIRHIIPQLMHLSYDLHNNYSLPYIWGTTGIITNRSYIKIPPTSWKELWSPRYKDQIMLLNDMRDVFAVALLALGYDVNDQNSEHIHEAYLHLKKLLPNIKIFSIDAIPSIYIDEDITIGMAWSGEAKLAALENPNLVYILPREGYTLWIENLCILKNSPHVANAHRLINFLLRPDIAQLVAKYGDHTMAHVTDITYVNGTTSRILKKAVIQKDLTDKAKRLYDNYWELLKIDC